VCLSTKVLKPISLLKLSPRTRGRKNYLGPQSHTFISLLTESRVPSPESQGPKNYSRPQSHTFTSLFTESRVSKAQKLFKTSITHFYFFIYRVPSLEGPKTIHDLNHTLLLLYLPSPEGPKTIQDLNHTLLLLYLLSPES